MPLDKTNILTSMQKLSILIPCYNEEATIAIILDRVLKAPVFGMDKEIIVIDDGSTDKTFAILNGRPMNNVKIIHQNPNQGKGAAVEAGVKAATGDLIIIQDADLEYDPNEYERLIKPILEKKADVVYGSRFVTDSARRVLYFWHYVGNSFLTLLSNMLNNVNLTDMETGYKVFRKEILQRIRLQEKRFGFEPEITAKIAKMRCRIYEVGISYHGRTYEEGKKINWKDGFKAIYCIIKYGLFAKT